MADQHFDPSSTLAAQGICDLKEINGIKFGIEHRLHAAGINTFSQLASLSPNDLAQILNDIPGLTAERIAQKDWIGQAQRLATEAGSIETSQQVPDGRQHYSVFTVELLLDENNNVRRTCITHVQSQEKDVWAGWEQERLFHFIHQSAALHLPQYEQKQVSDGTMPASNPRLPISANQKMSNISMPKIQGKMKLTDIEIKTTDLEGSKHLIQSNQPFRVKITLDLTNVTIPPNTLMSYSAYIIAKKKGSGERTQVVGKAAGEFLAADKITVDVDDLSLPGGIYRMEAFVNLTPPWQIPKPEKGLLAMIEGSLLQVY